MEIDKELEKSVDGEIMDGKTGQAQSISSANAGGKSEYSRIRDANIAQNKKLLSELGLTSSLRDEKDKATTTTTTTSSKKKGRKEKKELPVLAAR
jgi:hypothetical protein